MSERHKPNHGRDVHGQHQVRRVDVGGLTAGLAGVDDLRDDVRVGGAVEDVGLEIGQHGRRIEGLIAEDRASRSDDDGIGLR